MDLRRICVVAVRPGEVFLTEPTTASRAVGRRLLPGVADRYDGDVAGGMSADLIMLHSVPASASSCGWDPGVDDRAVFMGLFRSDRWSSGGWR